MPATLERRAMNYSITKKSGEVIEFSTALDVSKARQVLGSAQSLTSFEQQLMERQKLSELQSLWLLYLAEQRTSRKPQKPTVGKFAALVAVMTQLQGDRQKRAELRLNQGLKLSFCSYGANAGGIYITADHDYLGKITAAGALALRNDAPDWVEAAIIDAQNDPLAAAAAYGHETGSCSVCGRLLTDPKSIELGIGPICADRMS